MRVLIGYFILVLSIGQVFGQKAKKVRLIEFSQSECDKTSDTKRIKPRIISLSHSIDTLTIEIGFASGCCFDFVPVLKYAADTLYIRYTGNEDECWCLCCYSLNHKIKGINTSKLTVKFYDKVIELSDEKYRIYPPIFLIVKGDTLNRIDKYGLKQGIWINEAAILEIEGDTLAPKDYGLEQIIWAQQNVSFNRYTDERDFTSGHLYLNLKIKDEYNFRTRLLQEFYRSGKIRRECYKTVDGELKDCRLWDRTGREIK